MDTHFGKLCPYCKTEIKEGDEVTVCPACDIPHHKGCWEENNGCTTFGCTGELPGEPPAVPATETIYCPQCAAPLTAAQLFCPHCGCKNEPPSSKTFDAIEQFNQELLEKKQKKKKTTTILAILFGCIGLIAVAFISLYVVFDRRVETIITEFQEDIPSVATIRTEYEALTPIGQALFREEIVDAFIAEVAENQYTSSSDKIVNSAALDRYDSYKLIATTLDIPDDDGSNVVAHIDKVLELKDYEKYNDTAVCVLKSIDDLTTCMEYMNDAAGSYYVFKLYIGRAHTYANRALSTAKTYSTDHTICIEYINAISTIEKELRTLYYNNDFNSSNLTKAMDTVNQTFDNITDTIDTVEAIEDLIPEIN